MGPIHQLNGWFRLGQEKKTLRRRVGTRKKTSQLTSEKVSFLEEKSLGWPDEKKHL